MNLEVAVVGKELVLRRAQYRYSLEKLVEQITRRTCIVKRIGVLRSGARLQGNSSQYHDVI
jgi:hypothetical protein